MPLKITLSADKYPLCYWDSAVTYGDIFFSHNWSNNSRMVIWQHRLYICLRKGCDRLMWWQSHVFRAWFRTLCNTHNTECDHLKKVFINYFQWWKQYKYNLCNIVSHKLYCYFSATLQSHWEMGNKRQTVAEHSNTWLSPERPTGKELTGESIMTECDLGVIKRLSALQARDSVLFIPNTCSVELKDKGAPDVWLQTWCVFTKKQ